MIVLRNGVEFTDIEVDDKTQLVQQLLGENSIKASFTLENYIDFQLGDYVLWGGGKYTISDAPQIRKESANSFVYTIDFLGSEYEMSKVMFLSLEGETQFDLNGTAATFLSLIVTNLNRVFGPNTYTFTQPSGTAFKNIVFDGDNCLGVLRKVCSELKLEYRINNNGTNIVLAENVGNPTSLSFEFKQGLRNIERQQLSENNLVTRLYVQGSKRNIDRPSYGHSRLRLPNAPYLEENVANFGIIENSIIFEEIYPRKNGTVTASNNEFSFIDSSMDFDLNNQLTSRPAKVTFNTGLLAGYEFEVSSYNPTSKEFELVAFEDDQNQVLPNENRYPSNGDAYVIHDIIMPQAYIDNAEQELELAGQKYIDTYSTPNVVYSIVPDPIYFRENLISLSLGDFITIVDQDFGLSIDTRIVSMTQSIANPWLYSIKVGDKISVSLINRLINGTVTNNDNIIRERRDRTAEYIRTRQGYQGLNDLKNLIFDVDGEYFDPENIKPLSIDTLSLTVGARPMAINFENLKIEPNYTGNKNSVNISDSVMVNFTIDETIRQWTLPGTSFTVPDDNMRYIYVKASRTLSTAVWYISSSRLKIESDPNDYTFLIAILHEAEGSTRGISQLYGQTFINGRFISTGRIQSVDQDTYFDLDSNQFNMGDSQSGLDWNVTNPNALTIRGSIIQRPGGENFVPPVFRGVYSDSVIYYTSDVVYYNGGSYIRIGEGNSQGTNPEITSFWAPFAQEGAQGETGPTGQIGPNGADGADGINGIDGIDAVGSIPIDISPAQFGGKGDFTFTLDAQAGGSTNTGEIRVQVSRFKKPDGTNVTINSRIETTVYTPYGEGALGRFYLIWSDENNNSRINGITYTSTSNFIPVRIKDANTWETFDNSGNDVDIVLRASDVFLCVIEASGLNSGLTGYVGFVHGAEGLDGEQGPQGIAGQQGIQGPQGLSGAQGIQGDPGQDGTDGESAMSYIPDLQDAQVGGRGDIIFTLNALQGGAYNSSEIRVQGSKYIKPDGSIVNIDADQQILTAFGERVIGRFLVVLSEKTTLTRFSAYNGTNNHYFTVHWNGSVYKLADNEGITGTTVNLISSDVILAAMESREFGKGIQAIEIFYGGLDGEVGSAGPAIVFRGEYSGSGYIRLYNNSQRRDVVKYNGSFYLYKYTDNFLNDRTLFISSRFDSFGAEFESVATNLLLAENANIADWQIQNGRITSQDGNSTLYGAYGKIHLIGQAPLGYDNRTRLEGEGLTVTGRGHYGQTSSTTYNSNGDPIGGFFYGSRATIRATQTEQGNVSSQRMAIRGESSGDNENTFGGWFTSIKTFFGHIDAVSFDINRFSSTTYCTIQSFFMIGVHSSGAITCFLPSSSTKRYPGRTIIVKRAGAGGVWVNGNGASVWHNANEGTSLGLPSVGDALLCVWDGTYWQLMFLRA